MQGCLHIHCKFFQSLRLFRLECGLNMINFLHVEKPLKAAWVNRYCSAENSDWCAFLDFKLKEFGGPFFVSMYLWPKIGGLADLPPFYRSILSVWQELYSKHPITWKKWKRKYCGTTVLLRHKLKLSIFYKAWASKGIQKLNDLLDSHGVFFSFENFKSRYGVRCTFLDYAGLLALFPKIGKNAIWDCNQSATNESFIAIADRRQHLSQARSRAARRKVVLSSTSRSLLQGTKTDS